MHGVIVQFGGQTPLNLAHGLLKAGAPIIGTSVDSIDLAEDRDRFDTLLERLHLRRPPSGIARSLDEAATIAGGLGYPVLVRPSYVLGGRGMEICSDERSLRHFMTSALKISEREGAPILIDKFLDDATEVDVDVIADFGSEPPAEAGGDRAVRAAKPPAPAGGSERRAVVCGVLEHIEQAGIHSGDSACTIPAWSLRPALVERIRTISRQLARELSVNGLMNVQMAIKDDEIYILEVNPRASRTAPFVSKAKHVPFAHIAAKVMMGRTLDQLGVVEVPDTGTYAVKEPVFPFAKFPGVDVVLGPEMRSTGEVMGIDASLALAYAKAKQGAGVRLPVEGGAFLSVREHDRHAIVDVARSLMAMGFTVYATAGTASHLRQFSLHPRVLQKIATGARPNVLDLMQSGEIQLVINTPTKTGWKTDEGRIRSTAVRLGIPMITTATAAVLAARAIEALRAADWSVAAMQDHHAIAQRRAAPARRGAPLGV